MIEEYAYAQKPDGSGKLELVRGQFISDEELRQRDLTNRRLPIILADREIGRNRLTLSAIIYNQEQGVDHYEIGVRPDIRGGFFKITPTEDIIQAVGKYIEAIESMEGRASNKSLLDKIKEFIGKKNYI